VVTDSGLGQGFVQGLSAGLYCLGHCVVVLGPALGASRDGTVRSSALSLLEFSAGRLAAYLAAGIAAGGASLALASDAATVQRLASLAFVPLGLLLFLHAVREDESGGALCGALQRGRRWFRTPLLLGLFSGVAPCAPVWLAVSDVVRGAQGGAADRVLHGALHFLAFFAGTTVFLLPLLSAGIAARFAPVRRLARSAAGLAALFFVFSGLSGFLRPPAEPSTTKEPVAVEEGDLRYVFRDADSFSERTEKGPFPHAWAQRKGGVTGTPGAVTRIGVCFVTTEAAPGTKGWAGEIPILVGLSSEGVITGIKVLPGRNRETPGFIDPLYRESFDRQYRGKSPWDPLEAGRDVDGITGATVSVSAVNEAIRLASRRAATEILGIPPGQVGTGRAAFLPAGIGPWAALGLALAAVVLYLRRPGLVFRAAVLALSAGVLGVWLGYYLTGADLIRAVSGNPPPGAALRGWIVLVGLYLLLGVLAGKLYCGWLCPFGAAQELLRRAIPGIALPVSEKADAALRRTRFLFLLCLPAAAILADDPGLARVEPLSSLFHPRTLTIAGGILLAAAVAGSLLVERFTCKYLCPIGAVSDFLAGNRLFGRAPEAVCGGCVRGEKGCRFLRENPGFAARRDRMRGDCVC